MRNVAIALSLFALSAGFVFADELNKRTELTVNQPVIVAGVPVVTLEPGKYVIRVVNHDHTRNIVQIFNDRENQLFTTVLAINNYRLNPVNKTVLRFYETPAGNPIALRAWFAPGDNWGQEFVYPKGLAARIAKQSGETVLTSPAETKAEMAAAPVTEMTKEGVEKPLDAAYKEPEPVLVASLEPLAPAPVAAAPEPEPAPLAPEPAPTASPFFSFGLFGLLSGAAGFGLRAIATRRS